MAKLMITVGQKQVEFTPRENENLYQDAHSGGWIVEYRYREVSGTRLAPIYEYKWARLNTYGSQEAAAKALYDERGEASYGCDYASGIE